LSDLKARIKVGNRIHLTTDGLGCYPPVVDALWRDGIDYAQIIKDYGEPPADERRKYSPSRIKGVEVNVLAGAPNQELISTSYIERQNLTMRMGCGGTPGSRTHSARRSRTTPTPSLSTSPTTTFAAKHQTLKGATPAMAAGIERHPWSLTQLADLLDPN
jgi:hypothetical protein